MFVRILCLLTFGLSISAGVALAQSQAPAPEAKPAHTITEVIEWVRRDGTEAIMSHDVARIFGWGERNVTVTRLAFANPDTHVSFAFDLVRDRPNMVLIRRDASEMLVWQMSETGELQKTLRASREGVGLVDNAPYFEKWLEAKQVYLELLPPRQ